MTDAKILFPFTENNDFSKIKKITEFTKFGYMVDDRDLIDIHAGNCGSFMLGFDRIDIIERVAEQCKTMPFVSGEFMTTNYSVIELGQRLYDISGGYRSFFSTSGSDAIEGALKIARLKHISQNNENKKYIIGIEQSYHGSTYLSSSISGGSFMTIGLGKSELCQSVPRSNDSDEQYMLIKNKIDELGSENISSMVLETCSWRANIVNHSNKFWENIRDLCTEKNIVFIIDDIAMCGGKTGKLLGFDVNPDIFTLGKALTGGYYPLSACLINDAIFSAIKNRFWSHGFTYSFNMSGIYSTLIYLDILEKEKVFENYQEIYSKSISCFDRLRNQKLIKDYNNYGLYFNLTLENIPNKKNIENIFFENGLHVGIENYPWDHLQIVVPLAADDQYFDELYFRLLKSLTELQIC